MKQRTRREGGFTLVELTVSMGVIALSLVGGMSMIVQTITSKQRQSDLEMAKEAAMAIHEDLKAQSLGSSQPILKAIQDRLLTAYGTPEAISMNGRPCQVTTFPVARLAWSSWTPSSGRVTRQGKGTITLDPTNGQLVSVTVQVDWKGLGGNFNYTLTSLYAGGLFK